MKKLIFLFLIAATNQAKSQNVGIGTLSAAYPLTIKSDINGNGLVQENIFPKIGFWTHSNDGGALKTLTFNNLNFATNNSAIPTIVLATNKNIGIGLGDAQPAYLLDLEGRIRLQHNTTYNQTAGIWLDGTTSDARSFIGTITDDYMGIWGSGGAGWNIAMNVNNGNMGIGTASPTARLDVNGSFRFRNTFPKNSSVLTSADANGNAKWQGPVSFQVFGASEKPLDIPANTFTKFTFYQTPYYNNGLAYQPLASQFEAPINGIYHFDGVIVFNDQLQKTCGISLSGLKNNVPTTFIYKVIYNGSVTASGNTYDLGLDNSLTFSTDVQLNAGDTIWVNTYSGTANLVYNCQFAGRLVTGL